MEFIKAISPILGPNYLFILLLITLFAIILFVIIPILYTVYKLAKKRPIEIWGLKLGKENDILSDNSITKGIDISWKATVLEKEQVGFIIPSDYVIIYGNYWNNEHHEGYKLLKEKWTSQNKINLSDCNITSPFISIMVSKAKEFANLSPIISLHIKCLSDQLFALEVLKSYENVIIETVY